MKVSLKNNKWVFKFNSITIVCDISENKGCYEIKFTLDHKNIKIKSRDLDTTFLELEKEFNKNPNFNYS